MDIELLILAGEIGATIAGTWFFIKFIVKLYRWISSVTIIERGELIRLKGIDAKYTRIEAELKSLQEFCGPFLEKERSQIRSARGGNGRPHIKESER